MPPAPLSEEREPYPRARVRLVGEGFARGHRLVTLEVAPLCWHPARGELALATSIRFDLELEPAADRPLPRFRTVPRADARL